LALRVLDRFGLPDRLNTFATAMNLTFGSFKHEVDFIAWHAEDRTSETRRPPQLIIGETKSLGQGELITKNDVAKLKTIAARLPDAVVVIAVLRDHFTAAEKKTLKRFVTWGRRVNFYGGPTNPVLLLTSNELMMDHHLQTTWKDLGGRHADFAQRDHLWNLFDFADATQQIYLGMQSFDEMREDYWKKRHARREKSKGKRV
jgi:hypothetical protein